MHLQTDRVPTLFLAASLLGGLAAAQNVAPVGIPSPGAAGTSARAPIRLVRPDGALGGTFGTIQQAVDDALDGDTILIPAGTFAGPGNVDVLVSGKNVVLQGAGQGLTVVECGGSARGFDFVGSAVDPSTVLCGLTIQNGSRNQGAGLRIDQGAAPTLRDLEIQDCSAVAGGAIYAGVDTLWNASELYLHDNFATNGGGAISMQRPQGLLARSRIEDNGTGTVGGGLSISSSPGVDGSPGVRIEDTLFRGNQAADDGGAFYSEMVDLFVVDRCTFLDNSAASVGGAIQVVGDFLNAPGVDAIFFLNCLIARNQAQNAGGVNVDLGAAILQNCTVADNLATGPTGGLVANGDGLFLLNTILWGNVGSAPDPQLQQLAVNVTFSSLLFLFYNDVQGGAPDPTSISADPLFVAPASGDYHIGINSPCINAGLPAFGFVATQRDIDGQPRIQSNQVDIGADERVADVRPVSPAVPGGSLQAR